MSDAIREAFEKWWLIEMGHRIHDQRSGDGYFPSDADASWEAWQAALQSQTATAVPEGFEFIYVHPRSGEKKSVVVTRETVAECMPDYLDEMLAEQVCKCQPVGETNVVECGCEDYIEDFELQPAAPQPDHSPDAGKVVGDHYDLGVALSRHFDELRDSETGRIAFDPCDSNDIDEVLAIINAHLSPTPAADGGEAEPVEFEDYDCGAINDWGGGNVGWWQDYICSEIGRANEFWREQVGPQPLYTHPADSREEIQGEHCPECGSDKLEWIAGTHCPADVPDGRGRASEARTIFGLGCTECSETVRAIDTDAACEVLNDRLRASQQEGGE